jgi:hypothetical protein
MDPTHFAVIRSSGRKVPVVRMGRLLIVPHPPRRGRQPVSTCRYDRRFRLLPRPEGGIAPADAWRINPFHPDFVFENKEFNHCLRFLDVQYINSNP